MLRYALHDNYGDLGKIRWKLYVVSKISGRENLSFRAKRGISKGPPAMLPTPVMERAQAEFLDFQGLGASVVEISHRSKEFEALLADTAANCICAPPWAYRMR